VGLISETFRLLPESVRSDQATHSVAACGRLARELTGEHSAYGPRMGVFGDYCFSYSSPWQKMYLQGAQLVFLGVSMRFNTFKHFAEYMLVEQYLAQITDIRRKCAAMAALSRHGVQGVWPFYDSVKMQEELDRLGLVRHASCGNARLLGVRADVAVDHTLRLLRQDPAVWCGEAFCAWLAAYVH